MFIYSWLFDGKIKPLAIIGFEILYQVLAYASQSFAKTGRFREKCKK